MIQNHSNEHDPSRLNKSGKHLLEFISKSAGVARYFGRKCQHAASVRKWSIKDVYLALFGYKYIFCFLSKEINQTLETRRIHEIKKAFEKGRTGKRQVKHCYFQMTSRAVSGNLFFFFERLLNFIMYDMRRRSPFFLMSLHAQPFGDFASTTDLKWITTKFYF